MSEKQGATIVSGDWHEYVATAKKILQEVNDTTGASWRLDARFATGAREGAWRVSHGSTIAVLKWHDPASDVPYNPDAPALVKNLRSAGYPTPAWLAYGALERGGAWWLQDFVDGAPLRELDAASAEVFIDLVRLQRNLTLPTDMSWNPYIYDHVFGEPPATRRLREASREGQRLLEDALALAAPFESAPLVQSDMVHSDLNVSNLLMRDGRLVAVVDVEGAGRGCAAYDLLSPALNGLVWESDPKAIERLVAFGLEVYDPAEVAVVAACLTIETAVWYVRRLPARFESRALALRQWVTELSSRSV